MASPSDTLGQSPGYRQIAASICERIDAGEFAAGDRLPAIRNLASELGVNRDTVALAYEHLAATGVVEASVGRGTFVRESGTRASPLSTARSSERSAPPELSSQIEELLRFEDARPRFGSFGELGECVPLHALIPDPALYPFDAFRRAMKKVLASGGPELLLYGGGQGHPALRTLLAARFERSGIALDADELVLCHGASQGISLALRLFAQAGDAIAVEEPTYANVLSTLVALGMRPVPVPMEEEGANLQVLEATLARPDVKAFYTIPTFHNPLGTSTNLEHREAVVALAKRARKPILEDAFEMDLRYEGRAVPPLAALDDSGTVVLLSSYSKSLFPGVRLGALGVRGRQVEALVAIKHATDLSDSLLVQAALAEFIENGAYDRHLAKLRKELQGRCNALMEALEKHMPEGSRWSRPEGGYQLWLELPADPMIDTRDLLADAARAGVLFAPGSNFLCDRRPSSGMRLTVAQADAAAIERGVEALGRVIREHRQADPMARQTARVHL